MNTLVLHDDVISSDDDARAGEPWAQVHWHNPLASPTRVVSPPARHVIFSGWFDNPDDADAPADPRRGLFPASHLTWSPRAWAALDAFTDQLVPELQSSSAVALLRPHARHILADPQSCLAFLRRREGEPVGLLLDPAAFLTPDMLPRAEEHLTRAFEALAGHPAVAGLVLTNVHRHDSGTLIAAPLPQGLLDPALLTTLVGRHAGHLPIILLAGNLQAQRKLLLR